MSHYVIKCLIHYDIISQRQRSLVFKKDQKMEPLTFCSLLHRTVRHILDRLKVNNAGGLDGIPPLTFKKHDIEFTQAAFPFLQYINFSKNAE